MSFRGRNFNSRPVPTKPKVSVVKQDKQYDLEDLQISVFPAHLIITGTSSGSYWDCKLKQETTIKNQDCISYRQYILQIARKYSFDIVKLEQESENPYDSYAVKVMINFGDTVEFGKGQYMHVGYIPMKPSDKPGISNLTSKDVFTEMSKKQLWATGHITYVEGQTILGFRVNIKDVPF